MIKLQTSSGVVLELTKTDYPLTIYATVLEKGKVEIRIYELSLTLKGSVEVRVKK